MKGKSLLFLIWSFLLACLQAHGQTLENIVRNEPRCSGCSEITFTIDSLSSYGAHRFSQLQKSYDSAINSTHEGIQHFYNEIDSLQRLGFPTDHLTSKIDSIISLKDKAIGVITSKVERLKSIINAHINKLNLPSQLHERANKLTSMVNKLDITAPNVLQEYLNVSLPDLGSLNVPDTPPVEISTPIPDITNIGIPSVQTGSIGEQIKEYQYKIGELPMDLDGAAKLAEQEAGKTGEIADVQTELGNVGELSNAATTLQDQEKLKEQLVNEVKEQAIDHFAGKVDQVDKAMWSISKHKQKFPTITSLNDIPRKAPNEMKGKPMIERLVPGMAFQLQKKNDDLLVDFNLYFGYRFTKRLATGGGWNQRVGYDTDKHKWSPENARIYGPRIFSEYKLGKGFSPRLEIEVMNTFVPAYVKTIPVDPGNREWVWGAFVGMKKDYTLYKKIKGTAMVMLRLFDPERKSPYADVVNARFGFELPMKKKVRSHP